MTEALQRQAADPSASAFVTANAGTGKTWTLVARVARLLLAEAEPRAILCVTYTKAAAAEMQRRLFDTLGGWSVLDDERLRADLARLEGRPGESFDDRALSRARALFARALETPGGLKIQTIHAFCEKLLRRFPLEAGVSPGFQVMDDPASAQIAAAAREEVARRALAGEPVLAEAYARFAVKLDFGAFESMFGAFEAKREAIADYVERCGGLAGLPAAVAAACGLEGLEDPAEIERQAVLPPQLDPDCWLEAAAGLALGSEKTDVPNGIVMQAVAEAALRSEARIEAVRGLFFTATGQPRKTCATRAVDADTCAFLADEQARLGAAFERARAARIAGDTVHALALATIYAQAYGQAKARMGALDFGDLIERTHELLTRRADAAWVLYKLDGGIDHILVDEAQDTAPRQWEILAGLTDEFFSGETAARRSGLARSVFVVGDEKQSIFSFQGAAPERLREEELRYLRAAEAALRPFLGISLLESRRSTPEVLSFVDAVFHPLDRARALQPRHAAEAGDGDVVRHLAWRAQLNHAGAVDLWPLEREDPDGERTAWEEPLDVETHRGAYRRLADRIAGEVQAIVERGEAVFDKDLGAYRPAGYGDVLVLVRKRKALFEEILRALKRRGLPVAGADRLALAETPVFEDLLALARFVLFPGDDLTLAALLRSPLCDVDEEGLYRLARGRSGTLWRALRERAGEEVAWGRALDLLEFARKAAAERTPFDFYGRVLSRLDADGRSMRARLLTRLGPEAEDALEAFMAEVLGAEQRQVRDLEGLAHALAGLSVTVKREMDEPKGEVRVMTAHGAKGLEAPIVILPETVGRDGGRSSPLLELEDGGFLWCGSEKEDCAASAPARSGRKAKGEDEALRLLYVALTRARDRLIVAGRIGARDKVESVKGWWAPVEAAFTHPDIAPRVREVEVGGMTVRRFGEDPATLPRAIAAAAPATALPAWTARPAPAEPAATRYASPSTLADSSKGPTPSPLSAQGGLGRYRRGELVHRLLQLLPDLPPEARPAAAVSLLEREGDLAPEQRAEMAAAALGVLTDPQFAAVFGPGSRAEAAIAGSATGLPPGLAISGRLDRLLVEPGRVLVVDFKTNRPAPERIEDADRAYLVQMAVYVAVLREVFPGRRVEAALVWTDGPRLMPVPEHVIAATLAGLGAG